jgi:multidrug efflux pump subunit AcrA (membrane-fusion protein)
MYQPKAYQQIFRYNKNSNIKYWTMGIVVFLSIILFLPWTQNVNASGDVTTLQQGDRPQEINSPIPGKIVKWWVKEGDHIKKGDTILQLSEIKEDYLDPNLIGRTKEQVQAKRSAIEFYQGKIQAAQSQIEALKGSRTYKIQQLKNKQIQLQNKLIGEKAELSAAINEYIMAQNQYERQQKMYDNGLTSQTQLQQKNVSYQNAIAKKIMIENKIAQTNQELINTSLEQNSVVEDFNEKISKAEGDIYQSQTQIATGEGEVAKLENQVNNYIIRNGMYILTAPQDGQIVQAKRAGIGEVIKDGELITYIVPEKMNLAVEMFVKPIDLPLIQKGQKVRIVFDGFPAIVFAGWPEGSYGTFGGQVSAIENTISPNGNFRVLVVEDSKLQKWPAQLKLGSGAKTIALIKDVPIVYELWRNINGFPPDYYKQEEKTLIKK